MQLSRLLNQVIDTKSLQFANVSEQFSQVDQEQYDTWLSKSMIVLSVLMEILNDYFAKNSWDAF